MQFAGEIGAYSMGVTKKIKSWYELSFLFGVTPRSVSKTKSIETFSFKQDFFFLTKDLDGLTTRLYTGVNIFHTTGLKHQASKFRDTPSGYYPINSIRGLLALGLQVSLPERPQNSYFFEMGMNDIWIVNSFINKSIKPSDYISMALGFNFNF